MLVKKGDAEIVYFSTINSSHRAKVFKDRCYTVNIMDIPNTVQNEVHRLEKVLTDHSNNASNLSSQRHNTQTFLESVRSQMGWRERYVAGWFGGNTSLVQRGQNLEQDIADYDSGIKQARTAAETAEENIFKAIRSYLLDNDPVYQQLHEVLQRVAEVRDITSAYRSGIYDAESEIRDAEEVKILGPSSVDPFMLVETVDVGRAEDDIEEYTKKYQTALHKYTGELKSKPSVSQANNTNASDLMFDETDFIKLFGLDIFSNPSELGELRSKMSDVQDIIDKHYENAVQGASTYVQHVREACR